MKSILQVVGFLAFIATGVASQYHLGFYAEDHAIPNDMMWDDNTYYVTLLICSLLMPGWVYYRKPLAIIPGAIAASAAVGCAFYLYTSWRTSIYKIEILIPLFAGAVVGSMVYSVLASRLYPEVSKPLEEKK